MASLPSAEAFDAGKVSIPLAFAYKSEAMLTPASYRSKTNRRSAALTFFDAVVMPNIRAQALEAYLQALKKAGIEL